MRLFDTARRDIVDFSPGNEVKMYVCGVTPYDATHLGHAFTFIVYDVLIRRLLDTGRSVQCVRNVTDVDDPLFAKARELNVHYLDLAAREEQRLEDDLRALNFIPMHATPRASSAIPEIRGFIGKVLERGFAYEAGGSVYFDVSRSPEFGSVSGYDDARMLDLARERGGNVDDPNKRHPLDFVLWQPSAHDEPAWDTIWGPGRPGWHIECSALALRELGTTIDLHGGGTDLIYPHHECERAQSEAATGVAFVKHWMHVAMVWMDGHKMSKSRGNLVFIDDLRKRYDPRAIRLGLLMNHYRHEWEWDKGLIDRATARLGNWMATTVDSRGPRQGNDERGGDAVLESVRRHLDDDLDTPGAVQAIDAAVAQGAEVRSAAALLGVEW